MSKSFLYKCDGCKAVEPAFYNGEHWLPKKGWVEITDCETVQSTNQHLCPDCKPKTKKSPAKTVLKEKP